MVKKLKEYKTYKKCTRCGEFKPLEEGFHRHHIAADNRHSHCKECHIADVRAYRQANRDKIKESDRIRYLRKKNATLETE